MASPDNSTVPPLTSIVDLLGQTWTIGLEGEILVNGSSASGGSGSIILWVNQNIYVFGTDSNWWLWTGTTWTKFGPDRPLWIRFKAIEVPWTQLQQNLDLYGNRIKWIGQNINPGKNPNIYLIVYLDN